MGFFGTYLYSDGQWAEVDPDAPTPSPDSGTWLHLDIHDSDVATVRYQPHGGAAGIAFLGFTPRVYFEDEGASAPTDKLVEAAALADWSRDLNGNEVQASAIEKYLAADDDAEPDEDAELDDADIFVEIKCSQLLTHLGLPLPAELQAS